MKKKTRLFSEPIIYAALFTILSCPAGAQTPKASVRLDIYRISFEAYRGYIADEPVRPLPKPAGKGRNAPLVIYAHPDYVLAREQKPGAEQTAWIIQYQEPSVMEIHGKMALPMNPGIQLATNVYAADEPVADSAVDYGVVSLLPDTMRIAGYLCKKAVIRYTPAPIPGNDEHRDVEIWYTPDLPVFYLPPFSYLQKIPGAALCIATERGNGLKDGYIATKTGRQQVPRSFFDVPEGVQIMYPPKLK